MRHPQRVSRAHPSGGEGRGRPMYANPFSADLVYDQETAGWIAETWWAGVVGGVVSVVFGAVILSVDWSVESLALVVGILLGLRGLATAATRPADGSARTVNVVIGALELGAGVAVLVWPEIGLLTLAVVIGARILAGGILLLVGAIGSRELPWWWLMLVLGLIQVPLGIWALRRPGMTLAILITIVGIWAIVAGIWETILALEIRRQARRGGPGPGPLQPA
jgi:uncharacterized membrane protein HdeD (DUF308 family)